MRPRQQLIPSFHARVADQARTVATNAVNATAIAPDAIDSSKIVNQSITAVDVALGALTGDRIADSTMAVAKLTDVAKESLVPAGTILDFGGTAAPAGYLMCNGQSVNRADYPALFDAIKTNFGTGSNDPFTFNLPDLRGRFTRGRDAGTNRDAEALNRAASNTGGATNDQVGSVQEDAFENHTHGFSGFVGIQNALFTTVPTLGPLNGVPAQQTGNSPDGRGETRPKNVYVNKIIKY